MSAETGTYVILGTAGAGILAAFAYFIVIPAWTAYGRKWEKAAASVLTLFVLGAFAGVGLAAGLVIVYFWDSITGVFALLR